ncbi:MAG: Ig-like domain-containing protein [Gemmatimonadota bacterium]
MNASRPSKRRPGGRWFLLAGLASWAGLSCGDGSSGLDPRTAGPVLSIAAQAAQEVSLPPALRPARLEARVRPEGQERVVADTSLAVTPGERLELVLAVPIRNEDEVFEVQLILRSEGETEVFRSAPTPVPAHRADDLIPPTPVLLEYSGPGLGASRLEITPPLSAVLLGEQTSLEAVAYEEDGTAMGPVPVAWSTLDPELVTLVDSATGVWEAGDRRGLARIVGTLDPVGLADTAVVFVSPPPGQISRAGGNNQDGSAGAALSDEVRVRVRGTDGEDLPGQEVAFEPGSGGSVSSAVAVTNDRGRAGVRWTLGPVLGDQVLVARVVSNPELTVTFQAVAGAAALASITLTPGELAFDALTATATLTAEAVDIFGNRVTPDDLSWESSNRDAVRVSQSGVVTARANGVAQITASADGVTSAPVRVVVEQVAAGVEIEPAPGWEVARGEEREFRASAVDRLGQPLEGSSIEWSSSDPGVLAIDDDGIARGVAFGSATVTARLQGGSGLSATSQGTVGVGPLESLVVTPGSIAFDALTVSAPLSVEGRDAFGNGVEVGNVSWSSSDRDVAEVSDDGVVTATGQGDAVVRARVDGITSAPVSVVVASKVSLSPSSSTQPEDGSTRAPTATWSTTTDTGAEVIP